MITLLCIQVTLGFILLCYGFLVEYLTIGLRHEVDIRLCVVGFSVTPFQAFFHPDSPVYAPMNVSLQLIAPREGVAGGSDLFQPVQNCSELSDTVDGTGNH